MVGQPPEGRVNQFEQVMPSGEYRSARDRWLALSPRADRDEYFALTQAAVAEYYLADPSDPYQQSGRSSGAARWEETRRCLVRAIHRDGDFMDVGCANGLLLETLISWSREAGFSLAPHGLDFVPELIELARRRFPDHRDNFILANAFFWEPARHYDYVRTNLEYVPGADWVEFVRRQSRAVASGGRLIVCHYRNSHEPYVALGPIVQAAGLSVGGGLDAPGVAMVWSDGAGNRVRNGHPHDGH